MDYQENRYKYAQLETYKEVLELSHLKRKSLIVNILLVLLACLLVYFLFVQNVGVKMIYPSLILIAMILLLNSTLVSLPFDRYNNLKISMYFTVLFVYSIAIVLIFSFETPSIFTVLFLAYAISAVYQDFKAMVMSSVILLFSGVFLVLNYPSMFALIQDTEPQTLLILIFLLVFVLLLTTSSFILIKRKQFFYNQLSSIKEAEIRNIDLMNEVAFIKSKKKADYSGYFKSLEGFSKALSEKIGVDDLFGSRIQILKDLKDLQLAQLLEKYPDFDENEIKRLELLEFQINDKITKLATKASKSTDLSVVKKEIFSESQFKSFNHFGDSHYTKIISFAVFYTLLKIDKPYLKELDEDMLKDILLNSEYFYRVERDIIDIYMSNNEVFSTIVNDYLKGGW